MVSAGRLPVAVRFVRVEALAAQAHRCFETAAAGSGEIGIPSHLVGMSDNMTEIATGDVRLLALQLAMGGLGLLPCPVGGLAGPLAPSFPFLLVLDHGRPDRRGIVFPSSGRHRLSRHGIGGSRNRGLHSRGRGFRNGRGCDNARQTVMALEDEGEAGLKRRGKGGVGDEPTGIADHGLGRGCLRCLALLPSGKPRLGLPAGFVACLESLDDARDPLPVRLRQDRVLEDPPRANDGAGGRPVIVNRQARVFGAFLEVLPALLPGLGMVPGRLPGKDAIVAGQDGVGSGHEAGKVRSLGHAQQLPRRGEARLHLEAPGRRDP